MPTPDKTVDRIERAFREARSELAHVGSSRDEIGRRVAGTSIKNSHKTLWTCAAGALVLLTVTALVRWHADTLTPPTRGPAQVATTRQADVENLAFLGDHSWNRALGDDLARHDLAPAGAREPKSTLGTGRVDFTVQVGDAEIIEYLAAIVDHRNVVVVWSYRGEGITAASTNPLEPAPGKYKATIFEETKLKNGRTIVCSLFVPDEGVSPVLDPPSTWVRAKDGSFTALSTSPRTVSAGELAVAIRYAEAGGDARW